MENNKIRVNVVVAGQRFNIITDKGEKYVLDIASDIDARINSLCISGEMTRESAAVLTALDFADDSRIDKENLAQIKEQIKDYISEIERLKLANAKLGEDYNRLKAEYERLISDSRSVDEIERAAENDRKKLVGMENTAKADKAKIAELENALEEKNNIISELKESSDSDKKKISELEREIESLNDVIEKSKRSSADVSENIEDREAPPEKEPVITADDDLFFDEEEEPIKPLPQKKKNRHEHNHVNPYKQNAEKKKDQKGYIQQRQYTFFDINEE